MVFRPSLCHREYVQYHTPTELRRKTASNSNMITPTGGYNSTTTRIVMDTSMEAAATLRHRAPNEFTAILAAAAPRTTITSFFYGFSPLTGTGTTGDMSATATPTAGTGTGEAPEALAVTPNAPATGPEARRQHPSRQSLRLPQAATPCCPARVTSGRTTTEEPPSRRL